MRGHSQFTFTLFSRFLTTHLPLIYNNLHLIDHLPICKCLHTILDHLLSIYVPPFPNANYEIQDLNNDHGIVDVLGANYKIAESR